MFIRFTLALLILFSSLPATAVPELAVPPARTICGQQLPLLQRQPAQPCRAYGDERHPNTPGNFAFTSATIGGVKLKHHNIDWLLAPENIGVDGPFHTVIMQGASFESLTPEDRATFLEVRRSLCCQVRAHGAAPMLYMTHAYVPPHPHTDADMIGTVAAAYIEAAKAARAAVAPVGLAFARSYQLRPDFSLHAKFDMHPPQPSGHLSRGLCCISVTLWRQP